MKPGMYYTCPVLILNFVVVEVGLDALESKFI